jgi:uncharacterized damage-inducible protein DinB
VLERVPEDKLSWKPHDKSFNLGQLALHTASVPGALAKVLSPDVLDVDAPFSQQDAVSKAEILGALDSNVVIAREMLQALTPERAMHIWKLRVGGKEVMAAPRIGLVRALMFNHWYHHRGQLLIYLRLLNIPVPSVYGPTADENPFAN